MVLTTCSLDQWCRSEILNGINLTPPISELFWILVLKFLLTMIYFFYDLLLNHSFTFHCNKNNVNRISENKLLLRF